MSEISSNSVYISDTHHEISVANGRPVKIFDVQIEQEYDVVSTLVPPMEPDPEWLFEDRKGHLHSWFGLDEDPPNPRIPSCKIKRVRCDGACGDPSHRVPERRCIECKEMGRKTVIEPAWRVKRDASTVNRYPTFRSITLSVHQLPFPKPTITLGAERLPATISDPETGKVVHGRVMLLDMTEWSSGAQDFRLDWRPDDPDGWILP
jgi:hypothetical protein